MASERSTDVQAFIGELDGGVFETKIGAVLSEVASGVMNTKTKGKVSLNLEIEPFDENRVKIKHKLSYVRPTRRALEFSPRRAYQALTSKRPFVGVSPVRVHAGRKRQDQLHTFRPLSCNQWAARSLAFSSPASSERIIPTASLSSSFTTV